MSKLQTSLEKAIEKSRDASGVRTEVRKRNRASVSTPAKSIAETLFSLFKPAQPNQEIMEESHIVSAIDDRPAIAAYNLMRTRVAQRMRSNGWRTLLITSPGPGEGKTLTASNLAISLARDVEQSVLLVDLDLQRSSVAKYLGIDFDIEKGVGDFLTGDTPISEIVYAPANMERIAVIPNREPIERPSDRLRGSRMRELLKWIREEATQSLVIFDMPPVLACDDVLAFCPAVDAILLVVAQGQTDRQALSKATELLRDSNLLGVVLNKSDETAGQDGYGYY